jgi:hypothetical protein
MKHLLKRESWKAALSLTEEREKRQPTREDTTNKKKLLTLAPGDVYRWEKLKSMKMMMSENQSSQSQVHVTAFRSTDS